MPATRCRETQHCSMFPLLNVAPAYSPASCAGSGASGVAANLAVLTTWRWRSRESFPTHPRFWMLVASMASSRIILPACSVGYVLGIDVDGKPEAPIHFRRYDGKHFP